MGAPDVLDNLERAFLVSGRDDESTKLRAFLLVLRESAKAWYQTLAPEERRDWETLKTAFIEEIRHQEPPEELWRQPLELRQTSPNDYRSYEGKFSNLWEKWCASLGEGERAPECLKKDCFLAGLYPILREKVKMKFPDTFEKAMAYAREKDRKLKFQAQLHGGMEPPPSTQPIARAVARTSATDQESSQQKLLQQITNQLESLSINLVQGVRAPQLGNDRNRQEGQSRLGSMFVIIVEKWVMACTFALTHDAIKEMDKGKEKMEEAVAMPIKRVRRQKTDEMEASEPEKGHEGSSQVIGDKKRKSRSRRHIRVEDFPLGVGSTPYDLISDVSKQGPKISWQQLLHLSPKMRRIWSKMVSTRRAKTKAIGSISARGMKDIVSVIDAEIKSQRVSNVYVDGGAEICVMTEKLMHSCNWLVSGSGFLVLVRDSCNWFRTSYWLETVITGTGSGFDLATGSGFLVLVRDSCNWLVSGSRLVSSSGSGLGLVQQFRSLVW
ncbi:hypothetical protein L7F22_006519 [Adiantum nelumboides]|nr:hypothetical protein [Adiantum nelumboides]